MQHTVRTPWANTIETGNLMAGASDPAPLQSFVLSTDCSPYPASSGTEHQLLRCIRVFADGSVYRTYFRYSDEYQFHS